MKRHSYPKRWGRLFERYCAQFLPDRKDEICERADRNYTELMKDLPDIGLGENITGMWETGARRWKHTGGCRKSEGGKR